MDYASMNKVALRNACKAARISYGGMDNDAMRAALQAHADAVAAAAPVDLSTLGEWGVGSEETGAKCPGCGIDHKDNGMTTPDDMGANELQDRTLHELGAQHAEFACMGCGAEWGPVRAPYVKPAPTASRSTGTGLKIEKGRVERNGIKQPSIGGACRSVWDACSEMQALAPNTPLKVAAVKAHAATMQWNVNNAVIEFYRWKKWSALTPAEVQAGADADADASRAAVAPSEPEAPAAE